MEYTYKQRWQMWRCRILGHVQVIDYVNRIVVCHRCHNLLAGPDNFERWL